MGRLMGTDRGRHGRTLVATLAGTMLAFACATAPAGAETLPSTCTQLTSRIATANSHPNHGEGDVIVLNGMCEAANLKTSEGVSLPAGANFSIEGAPGTTSGFDGSGVTKSLVHPTSFETVGTMTLRNLVFQHANAPVVGAALQVLGEHLVLANDQFVEDRATGFGGGAAELIFGGKPCLATGGAPWLTVTGSTFRGNSVGTTSSAGGGALLIVQTCAFPGVTLEGNAFEANTLEFGNSGEAMGGALMLESGGLVGASSTATTPVLQRGNVFVANRILSASTNTNFGGGGEWLEGASVTSVGDRFSRNSIPGSGPGKWSWGGGAGILNTECNKVSATENALENAVVAGNVIGAGSGGELGGAGLYVGCSPSPTHPNHLNLLDSTVTENTVPAGGVAGVAGNPGDQLALANSIVAGDVGGAEIGGFAGPGGSLSASYSDVCATGTSAPLGGEGNICAAPQLANEGNPASFDVHETPSSPTIDAGRNTLVPAGLASDYFGGPRIVAGSVITACGASLFGPPIVDMGAAEAAAGTRVRALTGECFPRLPTRPPQLSSFTFPSIAQGVKGLLTLVFGGPLKSGQLKLKATFTRKRSILQRVHGHRRRVRKTETLTYANASINVTPKLGSSAVTGLRVTLKPTAQALKALARAKRLKVLLTITYTQQGLLPAVQSNTITVRYKAPPRKHRHR
jgi:hypothetical protein